MRRQWKPGRVWYRPERRLDFAELRLYVDSGDYRLAAIWESGSQVPRAHVARRPGPGATTRQRNRWKSLEEHEVPLETFEAYCRVLQLVPILDTHGHIHMAWATGSVRGLDATRYEQLWQIRERSGR